MKVRIMGEDCRVYFEEAGQGIPLVCLHTAGADSRQFRHLIERRINNAMIKVKKGGAQTAGCIRVKVTQT
jgi:hypothetical protein